MYLAVSGYIFSNNILPHTYTFRKYGKYLEQIWICQATKMPSKLES